RRAGTRGESRRRVRLRAALRATSGRDLPLLPRPQRRGGGRGGPRSRRLHPRDGSARPVRGSRPAVRGFPVPDRPKRVDRPRPAEAAGHVDRGSAHASRVRPERGGGGAPGAGAPGARRGAVKAERGVPRSTGPAIHRGIPRGRRRPHDRTQRGRGAHAPASRARTAPVGAREGRRAPGARPLGRNGGRRMTEDKLASALGVLRTARMSEAASARVREDLDARWRERGTARRRFALPWFVPSIAAGVLFLVLGVATLRSGADSALYGARVAIEDAI